MLNSKKPQGNARIVYQNNPAKQDLGIAFNPAIIPLTNFSS
jgi:hypothetical protein